MTRLKILFFSPTPDFKGGAEKSLFDLIGNPEIQPYLAVPEEGPVSRRAADLGVPVDIVPFGQITSIHRPVRPASIWSAGRDWLAAARQINAICRRRGIDIVHSNGLKAHSVAGLARLIGGRPAVFHIRDIAVRRSERVIWSALMKVSSRTIIVSRACSPSKTLPGNVRVIHNGMIPPERELAGPAEPGEAITLGCCGRIHPFKGLHVLIDWLAAARDAGIPVRLSIRGEAFHEDLDYLERLKARIAERRLTSTVTFEGKIEGGVEAVYRGLDAVAVPSTTPDPLPRSVMEAMGLGMPVIGYPAGGIPDMIDHGRNGWLVADAAGFVEALSDIRRGGDHLLGIRSAARRKIRDKFSLGHMHDQINALYRSLRPI